MVMELPRFFALESVDVSKYLRHEKGDDENKPDTKCTGEEVVSPCTKFEAEMPDKMDDNDKGLVHIRCCYNNKYLVLLDNDNGDRISPRATVPVEDKTDPSCTLFEPIFNSDGRVQFKHAYLDRQVIVYEAGQNCIKVRPCDGEPSYFNVVNWESLMVLPKHVAFKRNDGQCLEVHTCDDYRVGFSSVSIKDVGYPTVGQQIVTTRDGSIHLKSNLTDNYWHQDDDSCIRASKSSSSANLFQPIRVADHIIALRCLANNKFCRSVKDGDKYYLKADVPTINREARFEVEEAVLSRSIYNVQFRETDGRIYDEMDVKVASGEVVNQTNLEDTIALKLSYEDTRTWGWNFSASLTLGGGFSIEAGIPEIINEGIEVSGSITVGLQYASTTTTTRLAETVYSVNVLPHTSVKVSLLATKGKCDVPFSYTQCDTLYSGETETYKNYDGVFTGSNAYNLRYETEEKAL
ncbi:hypothetical protein C5167_002331 [Papaver somniferum]|uniref:Agglutinin domain-containing protein n=1 Tax=Papaver somniferum TaxID=3469 RepID=A0A4Y7KSN4_PAPSO|nr:uncharacterized protein LOC113311157 [Papaver somniferum]RZC75817.1 hypothetical protein C5167_002331 [Papaver somniferum]